ncbi:Nuclear transcription factor Y subunit B-7 [Morus notabilis]|uniref:Nuclear transcription factor Y subunit B-7 n=1 Tax=Morus notabilis TaxID=981085 RepID=W9QLR9_9ROSA|nr:nuclear transcription factor Y subunit B-3 [Morus notabilis]EXB40944.1 Nuclear transcription factor Y subunit B-7 [Morus notabilis]
MESRSPLSLKTNKEQDRFLPIANVGRIMKKMIPGNGKISKDAKESVQECVSEFISFVTGEASDKCQREKRKTINGDDIIWAITALGFEHYVNPLKVYLEKYREIEGEKLNNVPKQQRATDYHHHHHHHQQIRVQQHHNAQLEVNDQEQQQISHVLNFDNLYSPTSLMTQSTPFLAADQAAFSGLLPAFSPNLIRKQLQPQDVD